MYVVEFFGTLYVITSAAMLFSDWAGVSYEEAVPYFVFLYRTFLDDLGQKTRKYHDGPLSGCRLEI
jgi:hypothetical protein